MSYTIKKIRNCGSIATLESWLSEAMINSEGLEGVEKVKAMLMIAHIESSIAMLHKTKKKLDDHKRDVSLSVQVHDEIIRCKESGISGLFFIRDKDYFDTTTVEDKPDIMKRDMRRFGFSKCPYNALFNKASREREGNEDTAVYEGAKFKNLMSYKERLERKKALGLPLARKNKDSHFIYKEDIKPWRVKLDGREIIITDISKFPKELLHRSKFI